MKLPKISLEQWAAFKVVVEEGSFARAAEVLNKSQSSISYAIARLEDRLPTPVLVQSGRKAELTETGKILYRRATRLLDAAVDVEIAASIMAKGWEPQVTVGVDQLIDMSPVLCGLERFSLQSSSTRIILLESSLSGTDELLLERRADIVLTPNVLPGYLGKPLTQVQMIPVAHPNHPLLKFKRVHIADLQQHRQIVLKDTGTHREKNAGWLDAEQRWTVSHFSTSIKILKAGFGFAFLPDKMISEELASGQLKVISLAEGQRGKLNLYLVMPAQEDAGPATKALARELVKSFLYNPQMQLHRPEN